MPKELIGNKLVTDLLKDAKDGKDYILTSQQLQYLNTREDIDNIRKATRDIKLILL